MKHLPWQEGWRMVSGDIQIRWVNHASFVYSDGSVNLMCDPWLTGTSFNNGWRHISPTVFGTDDFADISHIWISHQHPDHFAPTDLRKVAHADRARIQILYQTVADKLVVSWLRSAGYKHVRELPMEQWMPISKDVDLLCGSHGDDSWLAIRGQGTTMLNVNDCVLKRAADIEAIKKLVGQVDILFTQFSYAQWIGNPDDTHLRRQDAREKFDRIRLQCVILNPSVVIPFASFIYFSNAENFFMNDAANHVGDVARFIENDLQRRAVVLYPGETWKVGGAHDWRPAASRYEADAGVKLAQGPIDSPVPMDLAKTISQIEDFVARVRRKNPFVHLFLRDETSFYLTDHQQAFRLSAKGLVRSDARADAVDVATSAENILYAIRTPWGGNTLHVSGRFRSHTGTHLRFFNFISKMHYYNRTAIDGRWLANQWPRVRRAVGRRIKRWARAKEANATS
jgi:UDP-MurNAc hydroxylase